MDAVSTVQGTIAKVGLDDYILTWVEAFLVDRRAQAKAAGTLKFYSGKLRNFCNFCETRAITQIHQLTPGELRGFLLWLQDGGHNAGGVHGHFRAVKTFLRWYENEAEPEGWRNPIVKVKMPKGTPPPLEPVELVDVKKLLKACADDILGLRDKAVFLALLDTGARAGELLALDVDDVDMVGGAALIRHGKGDKSRTVFMGKAARKALRRYMAARKDDTAALFVADSGERLTYWGLRGMVGRRAAAAGIAAPELHSFRRAFALNCLRAGMDVYSLQKLMGHADLQVLRRYLAQTTDDLHAAHAKYSPADRL